jgi:hypothetical protein
LEAPGAQGLCRRPVSRQLAAWRRNHPIGETGRIDPGGSATVEAMIGAVPEKAAGTIMYLTNNVPYAQRIEDGWSRQAPTGLVALTAMEFQQIVDASAAETRQ